MFPIGDDNSDRTITPYANYVIIGVEYPGLRFPAAARNNDAFTYAFSLVPKEITTGIDLVRRADRSRLAGQYGQRSNYILRRYRFISISLARCSCTAAGSHICGKHAVPMDLWRQSSKTLSDISDMLSFILSADSRPRSARSLWARTR